MSLIGLVVVLLVVGVLLWALGQAPFIDAGVKKIIYIVVVVVVCLWLLSATGLLGAGPILRFR